MKSEKIKSYIINYEKEIMSPNLFQKRYNLENSWQFQHCDTNPEFIVYHCPMRSKLKIRKYIDILNIRKRWGFSPFLLMITGEYYPEPKLNADYNISFSPDSKNNFYVGLIPISNYFEDFLSCQIPQVIKNNRMHPKKRFCNFIYSNNYTKLCPDVKIRNNFSKMLSEYKQVDSGGDALNNTDELKNIEDKHNNKHLAKIEYAKNYKFSIAFENTSGPEYLTEKIWDAFMAGSIPIYWGCPNVSDFFNTASFINCHEYKSFSDVINKVKEIDSDPKLFAKYLGAYPILANSKFHNYSKHKISKKMEYIMKRVILKRNKYSKRYFIKIQNIIQWSWFYLSNIRNLYEIGGGYKVFAAQICIFH